MSAPTDDVELSLRSKVMTVAGFALLLMVFSGLTGRLVPTSVPDSNSYLSYPLTSLTEMLRSTRTPAYPLFLRTIASTLGTHAVPVIQALLQALAAAALTFELRRQGTRHDASVIAGLAVAFSCTTLDHVSTIATDSVTASISVLLVVGLLRFERTGGAWPAAWSLFAWGTLAIFLRPAQLAAIPWLLIAGGLLAARRAREARGPAGADKDVGAAEAGAKFGATAMRRLIVVSVTLGLVVLGWMSTRYAVVNDFGFLPFGHQNLAGVTIQLLTADELRSLPDSVQPLVQSIEVEQQRYVEEGRQFPSGPAFAYMTMESRWDEYVWRIIVPAADRLYPNDSIASHHAIAEFNREVLSRYPLRYLRWIVLAARRAVWGSAANVLMHPLFLAGVGIVMICEAWRCIRNWPIIPINRDPGLDKLFLVGISYFIVMVGFVILSSPPLGRFADACAIFLPAWAFARLLLVYRSGAGVCSIGCLVR